MAAQGPVRAHGNSGSQHEFRGRWKALAALNLLDASQRWGSHATICPLIWPALSVFVVICLF